MSLMAVTSRILIQCQQLGQFARIGLLEPLTTVAHDFAALSAAPSRACRRRISRVESWVRVANERTSSVTTAKPHMFTGSRGLNGGACWSARLFSDGV
jgi:hypothetical protein